MSSSKVHVLHLGIFSAGPAAAASSAPAAFTALSLALEIPNVLEDHRKPSCLIPGFDGAALSPPWRDALRARFYTAAHDDGGDRLECFRLIPGNSLMISRRLGLPLRVHPEQ
jgi:hypothetical protein